MRHFLQKRPGIFPGRFCFSSMEEFGTSKLVPFPSYFLCTLGRIRRASAGSPLPPSTIVSPGSTDDIFQGALIDSVALVEINRSPSIAFKAGVKELVRIGKACALRKGQFYLIFVSVAYTDESIVRPTRRAHPFPFLDDLGVSLMNNFAKIGEHFAAPIRKVCDLLVNKFGWFHGRCTLSS